MHAFVISRATLFHSAFNPGHRLGPDHAALVAYLVHGTLPRGLAPIDVLRIAAGEKFKEMAKAVAAAVSFTGAREVVQKTLRMRTFDLHGGGSVSREQAERFHDLVRTIAKLEIDAVEAQARANAATAQRLRAVFSVE